MKHDKWGQDVKTEIVISGQSHWVPAIPYPMYTTKGLRFWKRWNEKNWRPQCQCGQIFNTLDDYNAHVVFWSSAYGIALTQARQADEARKDQNNG